MGSSSTAASRLVLCAAIVGAFGLAIYAFERTATGVPGWLALPIGATLLPAQAPWAQVLRGSLPSFVHTYVLVLLAVAWLARNRREALGWGLAIWALDAVVELLQGWRAAPAWARHWLGGTTDSLDLAAQLLGLGLAWATAWAFDHFCQKVRP